MAVRVFNEMFDTIALDFDGVILDSAGIKLKAFESVLPDDARVRDYLAANEGRPRNEKFKFVWEQILEREYTQEIAVHLNRQFSKIVDAAMATAGLVRGIDHFVPRVSTNCRMVIVSAAPPRDVRRLLEAHKMAQYFDEVFSGVDDKAEVLVQLDSSPETPESGLIFFGDTISDARAAHRTRSKFCAVGVGIDPEKLSAGDYTILDFTEL